MRFVLARSVTHSLDRSLDRYAFATQVAQWLGAPPRATFSFGNEMRPVPLEINIKTYQFNSNNEFMFSKKLDDHVYSVLVEYSGGKPALCFCHTKAETSRLAKKLSSEYRNNVGQGVFVSDAQHRSLLLDASRKIRDDGLKKSIREGVGYHNADLSMEDKAIVEDLFSKKQLRVVATTSTLAMGVNLPAHLVIIKGVRVYRGNSQYAMLDYSSILQMIGRAGRPQFDVKGVAVIMAQPKDKSTLDNILNLSEVVESSLIECLAECLNAEICNGMVTDVSSAMAWVQTTYLFARITKNPGHYGVPYDESVKGHEAIVTWLRDSILRGTISKLVSRGMVSTDERGLALSSTAPGVLMAENYVRLETMSLIAKLGARSTLEDFAWVIAGSVELGDSLIVRRNEKKWLNKINASALARYSIKDPAKPGSRLKRIQLPSQKAFALMMFDLSSECRAMIKKEASRDSGPIQGLIRDASTVVSKGTQIAKCIVRYFEATHGTASALCEALVFKKVLDRRLWPDDPFLITQTKGIGETIATRLVNNNIGTLRQILATDARQLEIIAGLRPPQGTVMQDNVGMLCPAPLRVSTRLEERRTTMVADVTIKVADGSHNAPNNTKDGWCRIVVFNSSSNAVLYSRRVRYSLFAKDRGGLRLQVDTCSPPDAESNIVVRIIDETVLGVDVRESTPLLPSTEAESRRVHGALDLLTPVTNGIAAVDPSRSIANGPAGVPRAAMDRPDVVGVSEKKRAAVSKRETTKGRASEKARGPIEKARGPSPTAQQTKLNFAPKKRARITSETENVEVIDLLDDDDGSAGKATEKTPQPSSSPDADADAKSRRVTSTSECAEFQSTYGSFLSSLELFMADDNP